MRRSTATWPAATIVLKDAYKTTVFALSRWRNRNRPEGALGPDGPVMPANVITKPPTRRASPRPEGRGQPAALFRLLDRILEALIDKEMSVARGGAGDAAADAELRRRRSSQLLLRPNISAARRRRA